LLRCTAAVGISVTPFFCSTSSRAFTNWLGNNSFLELSKFALSLSVPVV